MCSPVPKEPLQGPRKHRRTSADGLEHQYPSGGKGYVGGTLVNRVGETGFEPVTLRFSVAYSASELLTRVVRKTPTNARLFQRVFQGYSPFDLLGFTYQWPVPATIFTKAHMSLIHGTLPSPD